jgi:hypothetical protein
VLLLEPRHDVVARRDPDDALGGIRRRRASIVELRDPSDDGADGRSAVGLHDNLVARRDAGVIARPAGTARQERLRAPDRAQLHGHERTGGCGRHS